MGNSTDVSLAPPSSRLWLLSGRCYVLFVVSESMFCLLVGSRHYRTEVDFSQSSLIFAKRSRVDFATLEIWQS